MTFKSIHYLSLLVLGAALIFSACKREGCTDQVAENYDSKAKTDDGSCEYILGCTNSDANNYDASATKDDGSCEFEFIADNSTFSDWMNFSLESTTAGKDPSLGEAHAGNDSNSVRKVYFYEGQDPVDGIYPLGTVIVKQSILGDDSEVITALVKRGNDFDPDNNDWEYFILNGDGTIADNGASRGANLMSGACRSCHSFAGTDYVYSK